MRLLTTIFLFISFLGSSIAESAVSDSLAKAETCYSAQDFDCSIRIYERVLSSGEESANLYYNLGNAYFKKGIIAHAILNYERAILRAPNDEDIKENLEIARTYQVDKIESIPDFILSIWFKSFANIAHSNTWAIISIVLFLCFIGSITLFLFSHSSAVKRIGFFAGIGLFVVFICTAFLASYQKSTITENSYAIITTPSVTLKSAPDNSGKDLLVIHEGMKVSFENVVGNWIEIKLSDGSVGWVLLTDLEKI